MSSIVNWQRWLRHPWVLIPLLLVLAVIVGLTGFLAGRRWSAATTASASPSAGAEAAKGTDEEVWYSCGMHPNVLQKGPGKCPICHMKLTPRRQETAGGAEAEGDGPTERKILYWRAPMDPNYISDRPGTSPMGMDLVPVYADAAESAAGKAVRIDPVTIQNMGIRTTVVRRGPLIKTIRTIGRIDYDEQTVTFVDTKFDGWIEKLHVDETGIPVSKGQPLFDVYSPQLYSAQEEYLSALRGIRDLSESSLPGVQEDAARLLDAAKVKLQYLDVSDEQIDALRRSGQAQKTLTISSPASGIVTEKMALEGMYVKPGMRLYTIADLSRVWTYVDIYEYQLPWVRVGQRATMTLSYIPGKVFPGHVAYIYPYLAEQTRVIKVRLEFDNPELELKPEMFANVTLESDLGRKALLIPREAYIDSGVRKLVFVDRGGGKFEPRDIQVGVETESGLAEVLYGLDEGDRVVTSGQFMLDAESKLREAIAKMMEAEKASFADDDRPSHEGEKHQMPEHGAVTPSATGGQAERTLPDMPPGTEYACPMEEHPDEADPSEQGPYFSAEPGECPLCGMRLKPLEELDWVQVRLAAKGGDVAYTCPDHQHVFSEKPGDCPRCGQALKAFKVMYTCPDAGHAGVISTYRDSCPHCGNDLTAFRGVWLDTTMAENNVPADPALAEAATFRCLIHPLVHSDREGNCTICSAPLQPAAQVAALGLKERRIPANARYTCPMEECWQFGGEAGECPVCGMRLKPIDEVKWAREALAKQPVAPQGAYVCPMHPEQVTAQEPGACSICGMQLVARAALPQPKGAPERVAAQMDYITEHYLELQKLLASDSTTGVALHVLGLASASEELSKHLGETGVDLSPEFAAATGKLRAAALSINSTNIAAARITFVDISAAVRILVKHARPDRKRWPKLYIYHCPMSKGDWLQATEEKANPYYGFKMLKCGELQAVE